MKYIKKKEQKLKVKRRIMNKFDSVVLPMSVNIKMINIRVAEIAATQKQQLINIRQRSTI